MFINRDHHLLRLQYEVRGSEAITEQHYRQRTHSEAVMGSAAVYGLMRGDMGVAYNKVRPEAAWLHAVTAPSAGLPSW